MEGKKYNLSIKKWAVDDRPREKLIHKGLHSLSDAELLAILIGSGNRNESAVEVSQNILRMGNNNLNELARFSINELQRIRGIGEAKAISIVAALELGRRRKHTEVIQKSKITLSRDVFDFFHPLIGDLHHEEFWIIMLSRSNRIIQKMKISQGGIAGTVTDVKLIMKSALDKLATSIILCHNHPSGNIQPSEADRQITNKLKKSGDLLDIAVLDHVIIGENSYFSFADEGIL
ncbi:MAG: RadC family protein [Bacteroidota bacterium]